MPEQVYTTAGSLRRIYWSVVFTGVLTAMATWWLGTALGGALGLTFDTDMKTLGTAGAIWIVSVSLIAMYLGGFAAGKYLDFHGRTDSVIYGVLIWAMLSTFLMALDWAGASSLGMTTLFGVANDSRVALSIDEISLNLNLSPEQTEQLRNNLRDLTPSTVLGGWATFGGMLLSLLVAGWGVWSGMRSTTRWLSRTEFIPPDRRAA
ncbi:MAG: hypothetical protein HY537_16785 [Deltaproteobacteria bacterium]|nr:hypothetical protein [Deltaproteobacteria bacterium]